MATIINEPDDRRAVSDREVVREVHHDHIDDSGSGLGTVLGVILAIILIAILLFYGLPLFRRAANGNGTSGTINVNVQGLPGTNNNGGATGGTTGGTTTP